MCGCGLTEETARDVRGVIYCEACIAARLEGGAQSGQQAAPQGDQFDRAAAHVENAVRGAAKVADGATRAVVDAPPSVGLATFLGFIPGAGAMYNGQFMKAFAHIVIFFTLIGAADHISDFFGAFVAFFLVYMVIDSHKTAKARLYGTPLPDMLGLNNFFGKDIINTPEATGSAAVPPVPTMTDNDPVATGKPPIGAIILIGLGVLFLLRNIFDFSFRFFGHMWPLFMIGLGVYIAARKWERQSTVYVSSMMGPAIVATVGVVWLLSDLHVGRFWREWWPLILIVIGGVRLFGSTVLKSAPSSETPAADGSSSNQ